MTIEANGGCHCGAVRFVAQLPDAPVPALDCNCSVCQMTGFIHIIVLHEDFELVSGRDALTSYRAFVLQDMRGEELLPAAQPPRSVERQCQRPR